MSFNGANINKLNGGLGRTSDSDRVIVLIAGMVLPNGIDYYSANELYDITTAEDLGITATTDDTNSELTHYHLVEMFRLAPESTFWLIPVEKTKTAAALAADNSLKAAIRSISGVNVLGFVGFTTTVTNALTDAVSFQSLVTAFADEHLLIDGVFVEGVGAATPIAVSAYPDLRTITAPNVSYMIGQDPAVAALKSAFALRASIGTALGNVAVRKVHEDLGSVDIETKPPKRRGEENYSLSDESTGHWLSAALSDGTSFDSLSSTEQKALTKKGWMYVGAFKEYSGFYLNGCPTAVAASSDYAYFNYNCIWNKAARIIRKTLIPRVRSKVPKETDGTGYIKSTWITSCERAVLTALSAMEAANNIDGKDLYINPAQSPSETTPLKVKGMVQVGDVVHEFDVDLGLTNKL
jgi:hypothetical protein